MASKPDIDETWNGFIRTTSDAKSIVEACIRKGLRTLSHMPHESEIKQIIKSGTVLVLERNDKSKSNLTTPEYRDGRNWGLPHFHDNFLLFREKMDQYEVTSISTKRKFCFEESESTTVNPLLERPRDDNLYAIYGTLHDDCVTPGRYKDGGLMRKIIRIKQDHISYYIISYYDPKDVLANRLARPKW